jgi:hypothetical protein
MSYRTIIRNLKIRIVLIGTVVLILTLFSCEFEPSGICLVEIEKPTGEIPRAQLSFEDSTLVLHEATLFNYEVLYERQEVYLVEFYMDGYVFEMNEDVSGEVLVDPGPGLHKFEMVIYTSTGSGSIAEKMGAEAYVYSQSWDIIMEDTRYNQVNLENIFVDDNGRLCIEWKQSMNFDFLSYEIYKLYEGDEYILGVFDDRTVTSCIDSVYIGGDASYNMRLHTQHFTPVEGTARNFHMPEYLFFIMPADSTSVNLSWSKCGVAGNFDRYQIYANSGSLLYESNQVQDTSVVLSLDPETAYNFKLVYLSKIPDPLLGTILMERYYYLGDNSLPEYEVITQSMYPPYLVHTPHFTWDPLTGEFSFHDYYDHRGIFAVSPRNLYLLSGNKVYEGDGFNQLYRELNNLPADVFNRPLPWISLCTRMNCAYIEGDRDRYTFSLSEDRLLGSFGNSRCWEGVLSPNGNYLLGSFPKYNRLDVMSTSDGTFGLIDRYYITPHAGDPVFITDEHYVIDSEFVTISGPYIQKRSTINSDILSSTLTSASKTLCYDPISHTVLAVSQESLLIYDADDLALLHEEPIDNNLYSLERGHVAYMNKTVFLRGEEQGRSIMKELSF